MDLFDLFHDEGVVFRPSPKTKNDPFDILRRLIGCVLEFPFPSSGTANFSCLLVWSLIVTVEENQCFWIIQATSSSISQVLYTLQAVSSGQNQANTKEMAVQSYKSSNVRPNVSSPVPSSSRQTQDSQPDGKTNSEGTHFQNQWRISLSKPVKVTLDKPKTKQHSEGNHSKTSEGNTLKTKTKSNECRRSLKTSEGNHSKTKTPVLISERNTPNTSEGKHFQPPSSNWDQQRKLVHEDLVAVKPSNSFSPASES